MKKFSVILLIAVLAVSSVFAGITGSLTAKYVVDLDKGTFGYTTPNADLKVKLAFEGATGGKTGEGKAWVDAAVSLKWTGSNLALKDATKTSIDFVDFAGAGKFTLKVEKFNICSEKITVDLLKAAAVGGFASSELNVVTDEDDEAYYYDVALLGKDNGVTLTWNGYKFALALNGIFDKTKDATVAQDYYAGVETREYTLGGFTLQGAGALKFVEAAGAETGKWNAVTSGKFGFASDLATVTLATDQALTFAKGAKLAYNADVDVAATIGFVSAEAYYGKNASEADFAEETIENLLSGTVKFDFAKFNVPFSVAFTALDVLNDYRIFNIDTAVDFGFISATVYAHDLFTSKAYCDEHGALNVFHTQNNEKQTFGGTISVALLEKKLTLGAELAGHLVERYIDGALTAGYTHEWFSVDGKFSFEFQKNAANTFGLSFNAKSTKLVDGAELKIAYATKDLANKAGSVTTTLKVTF